MQPEIIFFFDLSAYVLVRPTVLSYKWLFTTIRDEEKERKCHSQEPKTIRYLIDLSRMIDD